MAVARSRMVASPDKSLLSNLTGLGKFFQICLDKVKPSGYTVRIVGQEAVHIAWASQRSKVSERGTGPVSGPTARKEDEWTKPISSGGTEKAKGAVVWTAPGWGAG